MNEHVNHGWLRPTQLPDVSGGRQGRTEEDLQAWETLIDQVIELAQSHNWSKAEVARRIGMPEGTFSQWFSGNYAGRLDSTNAKVPALADGGRGDAGDRGGDADVARLHPHEDRDRDHGDARLGPGDAGHGHDHR